MENKWHGWQIARASLAPADNWDALTENQRDMIAVGESLMASIEVYQGEPFMKGWSPADDPAEIVGDLLNHIAELEARPAAPVVNHQLTTAEHDEGADPDHNINAMMRGEAADHIASVGEMVSAPDDRHAVERAAMKMADIIGEIWDNLTPRVKGYMRGAGDEHLLRRWSKFADRLPE